MGFPDSFEKDNLHATECNFILSRPTNSLEIIQEKNPRNAEISCCDEKHKEKEDVKEILVSSLTVKLPEVKQELKVDEEEEEDEDGCKTPTSEDHKIPQVCPPAPRKPKSLRSDFNQNHASRKRVFLDLSAETIESLFPPALSADFAKKIKKVGKEI